VSGRYRKYRAAGKLLSWVDSSRYVSSDVILRVHSVETGREVEKASKANPLDPLMLSAAPAAAPFPYIGVGSRGNGPVLQKGDQRGRISILDVGAKMQNTRYVPVPALAFMCSR
jgi:hypothetical protein